MMCDITVFEYLLSRPSTRKREAGTLTLSIWGTDFENLLYWCPKTPYTCDHDGLVKTEEQNSFTNPDTCGRGLNIEYKVFFLTRT